MGNEESSRAASATIQGYLFQFDSTILSLLELNDGSSLVIEGIEDFDIEDEKQIELFQCKYYEATKLTPATIRDAIFPMLISFMNLDKEKRSKMKYTLYGFFKDSTPKEYKLTIDELKKSLVRKEQDDSPSSAKYRQIDLQEEIKATDADLIEFASKLTIHITEEFSSHQEKVIDALKNSYGVTSIEAETFLFPSARTFVSSKAAVRDLNERRISKSQFKSSINPSQVLFNVWFLREKGEKHYCSSIRDYYFCQRNVETANRIFIIEDSIAKDTSELASMCNEIRRKWSSHSSKRKPDAERYAPFVYFDGLNADSIIAMKRQLHSEGVQFVDGYPFLGSEFSVDRLCVGQTYANKISLRIISTVDDLMHTLTLLKGRTYIYNFFDKNPNEVSTVFTRIAIPVRNVKMIMNII